MSKYRVTVIAKVNIAVEVKDEVEDETQDLEQKACTKALGIMDDLLRHDAVEPVIYDVDEVQNAT